MTKNKLVLRYGLMLCSFAIVYTIILYISGMGTNQNLGYLSYLLIPVVLYLGFKQANLNWDDLSFGNLFSLGFKICLIASLGLGLFTFVYMEFIDANLTGEMIQAAEDKFYNEGSLSEEQIEKLMEFVSKFMTPFWLSISGSFIYLLVGLLVSLIMAGAMKPKIEEEY